MPDKTWCQHCNKYTYQTTCGCIECEKVTLNYNLPTDTGSSVYTPYPSQSTIKTGG